MEIFAPISSFSTLIFFLSFHNWIFSLTDWLPDLLSLQGVKKIRSCLTEGQSATIDITKTVR
ncbi:hypothetical protein CRP01_39055 [Flavilitoribacter nigricans DSM 23189 = NBRC 102662]|uniref:Uncharacterized protein n=1 Tax=Flavilitoribacter nigricans (strain ATCC 23147 / DSM 23189 / NBRC 102662 / NCIMB 1420 / SS-2) TaxID=1122177 RepID=A0A2D0MXS4_FLAN2|nr:hypothetical protein CRP01_39055 [Flavilitoribacter nigricans DSM 23189 = NBRC 102662]